MRLRLPVMLFLLSAFCAGGAQPAPAHADSILILKKQHVLELLAGGKVLRTYKVALGTGGLAAKEREGDAHAGGALRDRQP
jgi:hypothetical protein